MARPAIVAAPALLLLALLIALATGGADAAPGEVPLSWELGVVGADDAFGFPGEEAADSATAVVRRVLQQGSYISYGALRRDTTPCSVRGASYYNCQPGAEANPYSRGCSAITQAATVAAVAAACVLALAAGAGQAPASWERERELGIGGINNPRMNGTKYRLYLGLDPYEHRILSFD
uniref:Protein RALF-like 33 n=1 Tax=Oryza rufipogon TaxID=4529 RepID=A0A0E0MW59_ORYRU